MAYPQVQSITATVFSSSTTSHAVNMPATVNANDLLLCIFVNDNNTATVTTPSGWTQITTSSGLNIRWGLYGKIASGSEDSTTVNFITSSARTAVAQVYRITGDKQDLSTNGITVGTASGIGTTPNPPNLSPGWGSEEILWIASFGCSDDDLTAVSAYPSSYTNGTYTESGTGTLHVQMASARRENLVASENPATFTTDTSSSWNAYTIAIRPAAALQTMVAPLLTNAPTFYGATVTLSGRLVPPLLDNTPTIYDPGFAYEQPLSLDSVFTITPVFYDSAMHYSIIAPLLTNSPSFYGPEIINTQVLTPSLFTNSPTFYGAEFRGPRNIGPSLFTNTPTFYGPEIFTLWTWTDEITSGAWVDVDIPV